MKKFENLVLQDIWDRLNKKDQNCICIFVGGVGTGKSLSASKLNMMIDPTFDVPSVHFTPLDFYQAVTDEGKYEKGNAILWEEMGLSADKRTFMSRQNKVISYTFQTWRHRNLLLTMSVPSLGFIDSRLEHMINYIFETQHSHKEGDKLTSCVCRVYRMQHNPLSGKTYRKYPVFRDGTAMVSPKVIEFKAPPEEYIQRYKLKANAFKEEVNREIQEELKQVEKKPQERQAEDESRMMNEVMNELELYKNTKGTVDWGKIDAKYDCKETKAKRIKKKIEFKLAIKGREGVS